ncbi:tryptophan synthase subunit beta [Pseudomonas boanensis]|uniref:tryptophan synthase subunit beta n=1 Tax=Metapseudomonas boanensis TaxID=2822138 RepID=UPI0035D52506
MLHIQRDDQGRLIRVEADPFDGSNGTLQPDAPEVQTWYKRLEVQNRLLQLKQSDLDMIRVLDDLIEVLMRQGVIRITDLPAAAQSKLLSRTQARENLGGLDRLIEDEDSGVI